MKIIFCLNHFLPDKIAGIEVYTFNLASSLHAQGIEAVVLVPGFDESETDVYIHQGIRVIRYIENGPVENKIVKGKAAPLGLVNFISIILEERPDIIHFQELSMGRGIGLYHVRAVYDLKVKIIFTPHLSTYSCQTGNLMFKEKVLCDGLIRIKRCTACSYYSNGVRLGAGLLQATSSILYATDINTNNWNNSLGTALGFPFLIEEKKTNLFKLAADCDRIIALTHWYKKILISNAVPAEKITYCPQGLTGQPIAKSGKTSSPIRIVFAGRISKYKGVHLLIDAIKNLPEDKIIIDLYGQITEDSYAKKCMADSKHRANISWRGPAEPQAMIEIFSEYDLLCLPSTFSEMSPLVIQEAFAAGIPVLASDVYGNAEQIREGVNGWLFQFKSVASLQAKLQMLIDSPSLVIEAQQNIPATRSFETVALEHKQVYESVLYSA